MNRAAFIAPDQVLSPQLPDHSIVKVVGLGGVGGIVARYLALFLASLGRPARLVLVDGDAFEEKNSQRMLFGSYGNKASVTVEELLPRLAESCLSLVAIEEYVAADNLARLIHNGDYLLLTVDNHATRKLVNDHCATLDDICLISGGNDGVGTDTSGRMRRGTFGNVQIHLRRQGRELTPSLAQFHPEIAQPGDRHPQDQSCTALLNSAPQILFANLAVASAILNAFHLQLCGLLHYHELAFDIADGIMCPIGLIPGPATTVPGHS